MKNSLFAIILLLISHIATSQSPDDISNLEVWMKAESGVETANGQNAQYDEPVLNWIDQKNNRYFSQSDTTKRPTLIDINGHPAISFFAGNLLEHSTDFIDQSDFTYFVVASSDHPWGALTGTGHADLYINNNLEARIWKDSYPYVTASSSSTFVPDQTFIGSISWKDDAAVLSYNGARDTTAVSKGTAGRSSHRIGDNFAATHFSGHIFEVIIYSKFLNEVEHRQVENYLSNKYGTTLNYPYVEPGSWLSSEANIYYEAGNVGIGTSTPLAKLTVAGDIQATKVKVQANINVPDYVFEAGYDLPTLNETEQFILEYKHLPEIPSASEIEKQGIDVGNMNLLLLKKIEELTLYQIELQKRVKDLERRLETDKFR